MSSSSSKKSKEDDDFDVDEPAAPMLTPSLKLKSNMRTHRALALSKKGNEEAKDGMPSINDFVSGKLSTGEGLSKKTPVKEEETKNEDGPLAQMYHSMLQFFGTEEKKFEPGPFSLKGMEKAPRVVTKRVVIIGTDDNAQQYLHRKLLRAPGDDFSTSDMSKVGVIPAHKASHSREIAMLEITEIPFKELMEELDSSNSHLLKEVLAIADTVVFVYNAADIEETLRDDGDGAEYNAYCPSFIDLQNLYDTLANMDLLAKVPLRVVVGNVGLHHELKAGEVPHSSIKMAEEWAESHRAEGMKFAKLGIGNDSDVHHIGRLLESWMDI